MTTTAAAAVAASLPTPAAKAAPETKTPAGKPPGRPSPLSIAYEKKVSELDAKIARAKATLEEVRAGGAGMLGLTDEQRSERAKILEDAKRTGEAMRKEREHRRTLADEVTKIREEMKRRTGQDREAKDKLPFRSLAEMEDKVRALEAAVESGQLSLLEEKQALGEVSKLKKARRAFEAADAGSDISAMKARLDRLRIELTTCDDRTTALRADSDAFSKQLEAFSGAASDAKVRREESAAAMAKARKELDELYAAKRAAYDEYRRAKEAAAAARVRRDAQRAEWERRREVEERLEKAEERLRSFSIESPVDVKIAQCNNVAHHFASFAEAPSAKADAKTPAAAGLRRVTLSEDLADAVPMKKNDDDLMQIAGKRKAAGSKKRGGSNATAAADTGSLGKLPFQVLAALADLSLPIPTSAKDVPALFAAIDAKRKAFESQKETAAAEKDAQRSELEANVAKIREELENVRATIKKETADAEARQQSDAEAAVDAKHDAKTHYTKL